MKVNWFKARRPLVTDFNGQRLLFSCLGRQQIQPDFGGGTFTSDAGGLLLREVDRRTGLLDAQAGTIRLKLFKVTARVITSVRRVVLHLSSADPLAGLVARPLACLRALVPLDAPYALRPAPS